MLTKFADKFYDTVKQGVFAILFGSVIVAIFAHLLERDDVLMLALFAIGMSIFGLGWLLTRERDRARVKARRKPVARAQRARGGK